MASLLRVQKTGRRLTMTLDDAPRMNALSAEMVGEIERALDDAPAGLAALTIEGANGVFSAGADLKSLVRGAGDARRLRERRILSKPPMPPAAASSPASPPCPM